MCADCVLSVELQQALQANKTLRLQLLANKQRTENLEALRCENESLQEKLIAYEEQLKQLHHVQHLNDQQEAFAQKQRKWYVAH
jgi:hypothetical protein